MIFFKESGSKSDQAAKAWWGNIDSDLSVAAGVTAKDKRAKDAKNLATATPQLKKKKYTSAGSSPPGDIIEGKTIRCEAASNQPLPLVLSLGQVLRMMESKGMQADWPCVHLTILQSKGYYFYIELFVKG